TPWFGLYAGKKIFYNFDFVNKRPRETDDKEWLDVYLRTIHYPRLDDASEVAGRRALARAEARRILANRSSNLWPEPVDVLELANTRDPFSFTRRQRADAADGELDGDDDLEPILVFARPQGQTLDEWQNNVLPVASLLGVLAELLEFLRRAHDDGLLLNGLCPGAVIVDRAERVHYIGSDMVVDGPDRTGHGPAMSREQWARLFPAERYARGYAPPECFDGRLPERRADLYAWGWLAYALLAGDNPASIAREQQQAWACLKEE